MRPCWDYRLHVAPPGLGTASPQGFALEHHPCDGKRGCSLGGVGEGRSTARAPCQAGAPKTALLDLEVRRHPENQQHHHDDRQSYGHDAPCGGRVHQKGQWSAPPPRPKSQPHSTHPTPWLLLKHPSQPSWGRGGKYSLTASQSSCGGRWAPLYFCNDPLPIKAGQVDLG